MRRGSSFASITALLVLLLFSVFLQVRALPAEIDRVTAVFPEVTAIAVPAVVWSVMAIACWQGVALIGLRIVVLARNHKFGPADYGWLRAMVACLLVFVVLVVSAFIALNKMGYGSPGVLIGLIGGGLIALIGAASLALFLGSRPYKGRYAHA